MAAVDFFSGSGQMNIAPSQYIITDADADIDHDSDRELGMRHEITEVARFRIGSQSWMRGLADGVTDCSVDPACSAVLLL